MAGCFSSVGVKSLTFALSSGPNTPVAGTPQPTFALTNHALSSYMPITGTVPGLYLYTATETDSTGVTYTATDSIFVYALPAATLPAISSITFTLTVFGQSQTITIPAGQNTKVGYVTGVTEPY